MEDIEAQPQIRIDLFIASTPVRWQHGIDSNTKVP
jgi:hypothetical protein